ncbi:MAG: energy transducer TonB [Pseudomonadota bacterium]
MNAGQSGFLAKASNTSYGQWRLVLVGLLLLGLSCTWASDDNVTQIWADIDIDASGNITDIDLANRYPADITARLEDLFRQQTYEVGMLDGQAASSSQSAFIEIAVAENNGEVEIDLLDFAVSPRPTKKVFPYYPIAARDAEAPGWVKMEVEMNTRGRVENVTVIDSSHRVFEKPTIKAMRRWRFRPITIDGEPQPATFIQRIEMSIED